MQTQTVTHTLSTHSLKHLLTETPMDNHASHPLEIFFLPFLAPGHMISLTEIAQLFASRGHNVTIITTPSNANLLHKSTLQKNKNISLHTIPFPSQQVGLPESFENFFSATDLDSAGKLYRGITLLQTQIENFVTHHRPDCLVSDMFYPWTSDLANRLRIPRLVFHGACMFAMCMKESMRGPNAPHLKVNSDSDPFVVPGLPNQITMTRSQLPDYVRTPNGYTQLMEQWREAELKSLGVVVNNFVDFDTDYTQHYKKIMGHKVWHVGPTALMNRNVEEKVRRGQNDTVVDQHVCMSWLNSKEPNSVLYICFGSACQFPDTQLYEIACGLGSSGHPFIWVVLGKDDEKEKENWLPKGFEEQNLGMIVRGWAPQVLILDHPAIGGFLTHCGGNSMIEAVSAGVPMITWPLYAEHFYNEKLVTQVHHIGVEVGIEDWNLWVDAGKNLVPREKIEKAVRELMDGGDESMEMRKRVRELRDKAKRCVEEGGSSYENLTALIEELKELRANRAED